MKTFRVTLTDTYQGQEFTFAVFIEAENAVAAKYAANQEFEGAVAVSSTEVLPYAQ